MPLHRVFSADQRKLGPRCPGGQDQDVAACTLLIGGLRQEHRGHGKGAVTLEGARGSGGTRTPPSTVVSKASTTTKAPVDAAFAVPVTSIPSVWLPTANRGLVYTVIEAAGRVAAKVSTVATRVPSIRTFAIPQISHGTPTQRTPVPVNVKLAVAAAAAATARPPLSVTPTPALVISNQPPASVAEVSSERARVRVGNGPLATVTRTGAEIALLPASSRARAVSVCVPSGTVRVSHVASYGVAMSSPITTPSTKNCTAATPTASAALAFTVIVPDTVSPSLGDMSATVGGVVSRG